MDESLRVLVDEEPLKIKSALPLPGIDALGQRVVELGGDTLRASVGGALRNVLALLASIPQESATHLVSEVSFTLTFDAAGEVSLVSLAKGSLKGGTGLQFTIVRR